MANIPNINPNVDLNVNIDFNKSSEVIKALLKLFKIPSLPAPPVTKIQTLSSSLRPGLSATKIAAEIIRKQSFAGAPVGTLDDGSQNISEKMEAIRVQEIINALISDARITVTLYPGQVIQGMGANAGGPVPVIGATTTLGTGTGLIQ
jgi:hypothetical protein